ncbi:glycosyltransferase family 4 protein [Leptolyngbya sp. GGD]|uniref:glycosyltransferase family 4 protein n=1 Tax=Leptolyngbya sp. GGD TaxID=2997907 RepID=UPI00227C388D|nr:glycosyltransferase family 4 protein [Leptolyngbya sp. GGD]MCY6490486.1 glycosyltransferase family 4 protein [Leptolyngbya sp. GGD]
MKWSTNSIVIYANLPFHVENWAAPSIEQGTGGSEEAVIYLSQELVRLGYQVTIFNPCGELAGVYDGVAYHPLEQFNAEDEFNILIIHRYWLHPMMMHLKAKKIAIWLHDNPQFLPAIVEDQQQQFLSSFDKLFVLSNYHRSFLPEWIPSEKVMITRNGVKLADFAREDIPRNPKRLIYISDYLRGIEHLLTQWQAVLAEVPDAEIHLFYGWKTYDALVNSPLIAKFPQLKGKKEKFLPLLDQPNVYEHGRVGHQQLIEELFASGIYVYPCATPVEISCIAAIKAQACGCACVVTNFAALAETVQAGIKIDGCAGESTVDQAFLKAVTDLLKHPKKQEALRQEALAIKSTLGWNTVAQQWQDEFFCVD